MNNTKIISKNNEIYTVEISYMGEKTINEVLKNLLYETSKKLEQARILCCNQPKL